jgi:predicted ATPase
MSNQLQESQKKIVLIGGPGSGKTSVIERLIQRDYCCMEEISREVILKAKEEGIDQLFLTEPLLFSNLLLEGREKQFLTADKSDEKWIFFDRGIPDIHTYMNYFKTEHPAYFLEKSKKYRYQKIFHFSPWEKIHITDNERYESFEEAVLIDTFLMDTYSALGYQIINVPFGSIEDRTEFILNSLACDL